MNLGHLQVETFRLQLLAPVHIGDGRKVTGYEYLYDPRTRMIGVLDMEKFLNYIVERRLSDSFERYMSAPGGRKLSEWLRENAVSAADHARFVRYTLSTESGFRPNDLHFFVKDAEGCPYVPGSSIKGALRTALAHTWISAGRVNAPDRFVSQNYPKNAARDLEVALFNRLSRNEEKPKDMVNDVLSGIRVSDSPPLPLDALIVSQKLDRDLYRTQRRMPILRESLKPGTEIPVRIVFDQSILRGFGLDVGAVLNALEAYSDSVRKSFDDRFPALPGDAPRGGRGALLLLGGGSGFAGKTIVQSVFGNRALNVTAAILQRNFERHNHSRDVSLGVSPRLMPMSAWRGGYCRMGLCRLVPD